MKRLYLSLVICLLPLIAGGQALRGSYFSENSVMRNKLNPAFTPRAAYLGFGGIDNLGIGLTSNIGMSNFVFPSGSGSVLTFMHPDVSSETFLGKLPANPHFDVDVDTDILSLGFFTGKNSFWTIGLGLKVDAEVNLPHELFSFLKNGATTDPQEYHIRDLSVIQNAYAELSLGYSHDFSDLVKGLRAGARVKFLAAADRLDLRVNSLDLRMASDKWAVSADASADVMVKGVDVYMKENGIPGFNTDPSQLGLAGMGAAFDFGVEYRLHINRFFDSVRFSAAVTDLGFISYGSDAVQRFTSGNNAEFAGIDNIKFSEGLDFGETFNELKDDMLEILDFQETAGDKVTSRIRPQIFAGVEVPFLWNRMSLGLLYNTKFGYTSRRDELTVSLNMRPGKWFNLGVNYSMLNAAKSIGWLIETTPRSGIGFFIGSDYTFLEFAKYSSLQLGDSGQELPLYAPLNQLNFNLRFGFHIALGNRFDEKAMARKAARD